MPMSALSSRDVLHLASLASLELNKTEVEELKKELSDVLNYFSELQKLNTEDVPPTSQTTGLETVFRNDETNTETLLTVESATSGTDKIHNNYFVVPAVIDKEK